MKKEFPTEVQFETLAVHSGGAPDESTGAIAPPIHLSTTFERTPDAQYPRGFGYIRDANPTQSRLEEALAALDGGKLALAFGSGMAAAGAIVQSMPAGAHVILPKDGYFTVRVLARDFLEKWGMSYDLIDVTDLAEVARAVRPETRLIWAESPSNPLMKVADIAALSEIAARAGIALVIDGTFATPALQRPLALGADIVLHSTTKYLGGHSDVQGGALVFRESNELSAQVTQTRKVLGAVASPFNSWLILRGIRSLSARMRAHCENAMAVATFLESHPRVEAVHYPGLLSDPGHSIAARQMAAFGGMLSFRVRGNKSETIAVIARARIFTPATSLGGVESLIEHRWSAEGPESTTPENLIRVSVGLEHSDDLIDDLRRALEG
ncbi:MAG TPA: PLP-dependent transferase [Thermoanaerobaculia bacterium]|nr:PLP-dependent transferase [Thermoanaerobaculia bacterium]